MEKRKGKMIFFCILTSFVFLMITSKNSFLYPMNDWVDANAFFTVGKGMMHGKVPYLDLFEQKGPFLYVLYGVASLLSSTSFIGVFFLEVLFFAIFLYYSYKIIGLFLDSKVSYILIPILTFILCTSASFVQGGSAEEFCFPFLAFSLYHFLRHFIQKEEFSRRDFFIHGLVAGLVFMIKFTLVGFWFGFMVSFLIEVLSQKKIKYLVQSALSFLGGMFLPFGLFSIYFWVVGGFSSFIDVYFKVNLFSYTEKTSLLAKIKNVYQAPIYATLLNGLLPFLLFVDSFYFIGKLKIEKGKRFLCLLPLLTTLIFIYIGGHSFLYYAFFFFPFFLFSFIHLFSLFPLVWKKFFLSPKKVWIYITGYIVVFLFSILTANYAEDIGKKKEDLVQYRYAKIIQKEKDPSLLNYGTLDFGFYLASDSLPTVRYFEQQNLSYEKYPENEREQKRYIREKKVNFVIIPYPTTYRFDESAIPYLKENYTLIAAETQLSEVTSYRFYLYKRK